MDEPVVIAVSIIVILAVGVSLNAARQRDIALRASGSGSVSLLGPPAIVNPDGSTTTHFANGTTTTVSADGSSLVSDIPASANTPAPTDA